MVEEFLSHRVRDASRMSYFSHSNYDTTNGDPDPAGILIPANDNEYLNTKYAHCVIH
jgi:hypothetical protein